MADDVDAQALRALIEQALDERGEQGINKKNKITIVAWDGHLDRIWPTLILSTTAAASGMEVSVFFTFWGLFPLVYAGAGLVRLAVDASQLHRHQDVFKSGQRRHQLERLEDEADFLGPELRAGVFAEAPEIDTVERDGALRGPVETGQQAKQGGLAAARRPHDRHELSRRDGQVNFPQHDERLAATQVRLFEVFGHDHEKNLTAVGVLGVRK